MNWILMRHEEKERKEAEAKGEKSADEVGKLINKKGCMTLFYLFT